MGLGTDMPGGRPVLYESPEGFKSAADLYFAECLTDDRVPTVNGLALALGFNSRQSLLNYAEKPQFLDVVKRVRARLEMAWEERLGESACTGAIFWLKNQGWTDKTEVAHSGHIAATEPSELSEDEIVARLAALRAKG